MEREAIRKRKSQGEKAVGKRKRRKFEVNFLLLENKESRRKHRLIGRIINKIRIERRKRGKKVEKKQKRERKKKKKRSKHGENILRSVEMNKF